MKGDCPCTEEDALCFLDELSAILDSDPLIDELGIIHPSQLAALNDKTDASSGRLESDVLSSKTAIFWSRDHKLGISTQYLLPLYNAAKSKFMEALLKYKFSTDSDEKKHESSAEYDLSSFTLSGSEAELMNQSKLLLLLSGDFATAWNARKLVVLKKPHFAVIRDELLLSSLVLSLSPKTEQAWSHRRWAIKIMADKSSILSEIVKKESKLVEKIAEKSKMNYRAWNHRCWLVSFMSGPQVLDELEKSRKWAGLHVADSSCFHYRRRLMLKMLDVMRHEKTTSPCISLYQLWKEELDWNEMLIRRYVGREALWLHRRFLSLCWLKHMSLDGCSSGRNLDSSRNTENLDTDFMEKEVCLLHHCLNKQENGFEDVRAQAVHSASYTLWLNMFLDKEEIKHEKLKAEDLRTLLYRLCPEKTQFWESLLGRQGDNPNYEMLCWLKLQC